MPKILHTSLYSLLLLFKNHPSGEPRASALEIADSSEYGLIRLNAPTSSSETSESSFSADIVFVHGLNGHWAKTWTHENGTFWPRDLLPQAIPGSRIFSYGYPSKVFASKSLAVIHDFAKHLLDDLVLVQKVLVRECSLIRLAAD